MPDLSTSVKTADSADALMWGSERRNALSRLNLASRVSMSRTGELREPNTIERTQLSYVSCIVANACHIVYQTHMNGTMSTACDVGLSQNGYGP